MSVNIYLHLHFFTLMADLFTWIQPAALCRCWMLFIAVDHRPLQSLANSSSLYTYRQLLWYNFNCKSILAFRPYVFIYLQKYHKLRRQSHDSLVSITFRVNFICTELSQIFSLFDPLNWNISEDLTLSNAIPIGDFKLILATLGKEINIFFNPVFT